MRSRVVPVVVAGVVGVLVGIVAGAQMSAEPVGKSLHVRDVSCRAAAVAANEATFDMFELVGEAVHGDRGVVAGEVSGVVDAWGTDVLPLLSACGVKS